jgi:hypothetical protein
MIPDIAAKSGIFASDIPILNGSKRANEHFSGTFWQRDNGSVTAASAVEMRLAGRDRRRLAVRARDPVVIDAASFAGRRATIFDQPSQGAKAPAGIGGSGSGYGSGYAGGLREPMEARAASAAGRWQQSLGLSRFTYQVPPSRS